MRTMHLFAGAGGGLLADLILGHRPIVAVEWDKYACNVLRARASDGWFPGLRVWEGDVQLFDPSEYAGKVDCIHAGFPCQDLSVAGAGAGLGKETRSGLYREVLRVADTVRPRYLFMENVANINSAGVGTVYGDLASLGYEFRSICLRASDVGAPHHRDRWWCLARRNELSSYPEHNGDGRGQQQPQGDEKATSENISNSGCIRQQGQGQSIHSIGSKANGERKTNKPENERVHDFWSVEPRLDRVAYGVASRSHRLKCIGNGQVPLQAATAFRILEKLFRG